LTVIALLLWIYKAISEKGPQQFRGRDVRYWLQLSLCDDCGGTESEHETVEYLSRVPAYRRLLDKYPAARIGRLMKNPATGNHG
jgi:hypothetical protein